MSNQPTEETKTQKKVKKSDAERKRRVVAFKETLLDKTGIGCAPSKVKNVLSQNLNPEESSAIAAIIEAEARPKKTKSNADDTQESKETPRVQVPISKLSHDVQLLLKRAREVYHASLRSKYEKYILNKKWPAKALTPEMETARKNYMDARKAAEKSDDFDVEKFNKSQFPGFYDEYKTFCAETEKATKNRRVGKNNSTTTPRPITEWSEACSLISKLRIRYAFGVRFTIAAYLDRLVEAFATQSIEACMSDNKNMVSIYYALQHKNAFTPFVSTFGTYERAMQWKQKYDAYLARDKTKVLTKPEYEDTTYPNDFQSFVGNIYNSVKNRLAKAAPTPEKRDRYLSLSFKKDLKLFCSSLIHECVERVAKLLKNNMGNKAKTINNEMVYSVLKQVHLTCGMDFDSVEVEMIRALEKNSQFRMSEKNKPTDELKETSQLPVDKQPEMATAQPALKTSDNKVSPVAPVTKAKTRAVKQPAKAAEVEAPKKDTAARKPTNRRQPVKQAAHDEPAY